MNAGDKKLLELEQQFVEFVRKRFKSPAEMDEMERRRVLLMNALLQQSKPLHDDVLAVGIRIKSVSDFVNTADKYPEAIPVLTKHLKKPYHPNIKEGIVRALAVKEAKGIANKAIMDEYHKAPKKREGFKWVFGNTMSVIVTRDDLDELLKIVLDEGNGDSRTGFIEALAKLKSPKVIEALHQLENDKSQIVAERAKKILARKAKAQERKTKKQA